MEEERFRPCSIFAASLKVPTARPATLCSSHCGYLKEHRSVQAEVTHQPRDEEKKGHGIKKDGLLRSFRVTFFPLASWFVSFRLF